MRILMISILLAAAANIFAQKVAVHGYDVVDYFNQEAKEGSSKISAIHDGKTYHFSSNENKVKFENAPTDYAPAYDGYCAYAMAKTGDLVEINPKTFEIRDGRLFLFYNKNFTNTLKSWLKENPDQLVIDADENWAKL